MVSKAAERLKCEPDTVRNYVKRYPRVAEALHEERESMTDVAEMALFDAIKGGEGWAVCFYLKTQGKERGYVERHEFTGKDGEALQIHLSWGDASYQDESVEDYPAPPARRPALGAAESGAIQSDPRREALG